MVEVNKGVLIIGLSNTVLFGGEQTVDLLLLDLASGKDFSLPISDEQAEFLLQHVTFSDMLDIAEEEQAEPEVEEEEVDQAVLRARLDNILSTGVEEATGDISDAWSSAEATPQL